MISYDLAKKLKDRGFPQATEFHFIDGAKEPERQSTWQQIEGEWGAARPISKVECIAAPTLEELLDVCAANFGNLVLNHQDASWKAFAHDGIRFCSGLTHQEAVANLWLALNPSKAPSASKDD